MGVSRVKAQITIWHANLHWGFATSPEGNTFFVHQSAVKDRRQIPHIDYGSTVTFDLREERTAEQQFLDKLNAGKFRDDETLEGGHRNPRLPRDPRDPRRVVLSTKKPVAINVVLVEGSPA
jgi:cold shock CspA family protein